MTTLPTHEHTPSIVAVGKKPLSPIHRPARPSAIRRGMTGRDFMRVVRKHLWLILVLLTVLTSASIGGTWFWLRESPTFTSYVRLSVDPPRQDVYATEARHVAADLDILKQTYVDTAKHEGVLELAINEDIDDQQKRLDRIRKTTYFTGDRRSTVALLKDELSVSPVRGTTLVQISLSGPNPDELPEVVNAVAAALVKYSGKINEDKRNKRMNSLTSRLQETNNEIGVKRRSIESAQGESEIPLMRERRNIMQMTLQSLTDELTTLRLLKAQAETALKSLSDQKAAKTLEKSPEVLRALEQDPTYRSMEVNKQNLVIERDSLLDRFLPKHRRVQAVVARLKMVEAAQKALAKTLVAKQIAAMLQQQNSQVTAVSERLLTVGTQYAEEAAKLRDLGSSLTKISTLESEIKALQANAAQVAAALVEFRIARENTPLSIHALGEIPTEPSWPKYSIMVPLGVLLGLGLGLGLAFLMELMDTSIKSPADISSRIDLPLLGMIPHEDDMDEDVADMRTLMLSNSDSLAGEAYRQIRTCLLFSGPASQRRSLMVTSPSPGDGRTAVTMNLAASIAQGGRKVLVVDANFRQPSVAALFPQAPLDGLSSALVGQGRWEDNVFEVDRNLSVMTSGPLPPNPAELLGSEQFRTLLGEMTAKYDQVIFDAAPALVVTDPSVLSTMVDGVIIVVRAGSSTHGILQRTRDIFLRVGAHVIGAVLNCVRVTAGGYLKRNYNTFYEYRGQQLPAAVVRATPSPTFPPDPPAAGGGLPETQQSSPPEDLGLS